MFHGPQADQRACSTEARLAVNGNSARVLRGEMLIRYLHELVDDLVGRRGSINEKEVIVMDADFGEVPLVILLFIKSDDSLDVEALEDFCVLIRMVTVALIRVTLLDGSHERHEFSRDDPVDVAVLDTLIELILLDVERFEVVPLKLDGILETLEALQQCAIIEAISLACIAVRLEKVVIRSEHAIGLLGCTLEDYYHEGAHKERTVHHLVRLVRSAVVEDTVAFVVIVFKKSRQLARKPMDHGQIERSKVLVEREVRKVVVDVEEERVLVVLWRLRV